jgi:ribosome hibernation promoting factor
MIERLEIDGVHMSVSDDLRKYVGNKIGRLDHYLPRRVRASLHAEVKLKEGKAKDKKERTCEVILHLPHETVRVQESTVNIYAAIDIVETKLQNQIRKYKDLHLNPKLHRRVLARLKRQPA